MQEEVKWKYSISNVMDVLLCGRDAARGDNKELERAEDDVGVTVQSLTWLC